jgi:choline dehydrogenase-like flavoprotein
VKGVQNLRIVDASVMRNQIAGNPHAPAIMIAEKAADILYTKDKCRFVYHGFPYSNLLFEFLCQN